MRSVKFPGKAARVLAMILAFLCTMTLVLSCLAWQMNRAVTDRALHYGVALDSRVTSAQMDRIRAEVNSIAGKHPFGVETVMQFITPDALAQQSRAVVDWWMGIFQPDPEVNAPAWNTRDIEEAVREDEVFQAHTDVNFRRAVARDDIAYEVGQAVNKALLPVRADILSVALPTVLARVDMPSLMHALSLAPWLLLIVSVMLMLLIVCLMHKRISAAGLYIGASLIGAALAVAGVGVMAFLFGVPAMVAQISELLAMQVSLFTKQVALQTGLAALAAVLLGVGLILWHQQDMGRLAARQRSTQR